MKYDVFISYRQKSGIHQADALESKLKLKLNGCRVFLDRTGIKSGNWKKELDENIRESCNFVVIISKDCFPYTKKGKDYFLDEIDQALRLGKNVIPVYYDDMSYEDIKEYLSGIEDFHNQQHIIFNNNNTDGSVDQIIKFLKTEKEILNERYKSLSKERTTVRQELMLLEEDKTDSKCPVCATSYTAEMIYCHNCGYKFFDDLEKAVANSYDKIQERERLKKHKEIWRKCQSDNQQDTTALNQELEATKAQLKNSEAKCVELEKQFETFKKQTKGLDWNKEILVIPVNDIVSFKMIRVEGGSKGTFYMGETQVTQALWQAVMGNNPSQYKGPDHPVECVSWFDICGEDGKGTNPDCFLYKLNKKTGKNFRLPTEAEWEYAALGGNKSKGYVYAGSDDIDKVAWHDGNSKNSTHPVKQLSPNELGIYDMSGNVWEWCEDLYNSFGSLRVLRGGSWSFSARGCRVSSRDYYGPAYRNYGIGFRLVLPQ